MKALGCRFCGRKFSVLCVSLCVLFEAFVSGCVEGPEVVETRADVRGGTLTSTFPQVVSLGDYDDEGDLYALCTGTVIAEDLVLTAAHCVEGLAPSVVEQVVGLTPTIANSIAGEAPGAVHRVTGKVVHPERDAERFVSDIAVVKVSPPFSSVSPLPATQVDAVSMEENPVKIVGFGDAFPGQLFDGSGSKREADAVVRSAAGVSARIAVARGEIDLGLTLAIAEAVGDRLAIAVEANKGLGCRGDSGAPMLRARASGGYEQIGVLSFGDSAEAFEGSTGCEYFNVFEPVDSAFIEQAREDLGSISLEATPDEEDAATPPGDAPEEGENPAVPVEEDSGAGHFGSTSEDDASTEQSPPTDGETVLANTLTQNRATEDGSSGCQVVATPTPLSFLTFLVPALLLRRRRA